MSNPSEPSRSQAYKSILGVVNQARRAIHLMSWRGRSKHGGLAQLGKSGAKYPWSKGIPYTL